MKWLLSGANEIIAYADEFDNDEFDGTDRVVFRITDAGGGNFLFDLEDQLDHPAGSGDSGVTANLTLDLSPAFAAKDFDGDQVPLQSVACGFWSRMTFRSSLRGPCHSPW